MLPKVRIIKRSGMQGSETVYDTGFDVSNPHQRKLSTSYKLNRGLKPNHRSDFVKYFGSDSERIRNSSASQGYRLSDNSYY